MYGRCVKVLVFLAAMLALAGCVPMDLALSPEVSRLPCEGGSVLLTLTADLPQTVSVAPTDDELPMAEIRWYHDGIQVAAGFGEGSDLFTATEPGTYWAELWMSEELLTELPFPAPGVAATIARQLMMVEVAESNHVAVLGCETVACVRSDVSVIVYGGWNGIPVNAWVGGTAQPQQLTAKDSNGLPAVLWTFYPPAGEEWSVSAAPSLPPGLDATRWSMRLVRIASQDGKHTITEPATASVSISPCDGWAFYYQLVDNGAPAATP